MSLEGVVGWTTSVEIVQFCVAVVKTPIHGNEKQIKYLLSVLLSRYMEYIELKASERKYISYFITVTANSTKFFKKKI